jgi:hypothetical protein
MVAAALVLPLVVEFQSENRLQKRILLCQDTSKKDNKWNHPNIYLGYGVILNKQG